MNDVHACQFEAELAKVTEERDIAYIALRRIARALLALPTDINIGAEYDVPNGGVVPIRVKDVTK